MRRYPLDTTPLAAYLQGRESAVSLITPWLDQNEVATSILVYGEVVEHLRRMPDFPNQQSQPRRLMRDVYPYFLTYPIMERCANPMVRVSLATSIH